MNFNKSLLIILIFTINTLSYSQGKTQNLKIRFDKEIQTLNFDKAEKTIYELAELNDSYAYLILGNMYNNNFGSERGRRKRPYDKFYSRYEPNSEKAIEMYLKSKEPDAYYHLASIYSLKSDRTQNVEEKKMYDIKVFNTLKKGAELNHQECMDYTARNYSRGVGCIQSYSKAAELQKKLALLKPTKKDLAPLEYKMDNFKTNLTDSQKNLLRKKFIKNYYYFIIDARIKIIENYREGTDRNNFNFKKSDYMSYVWYLIYNEHKKYRYHYQEKYIQMFRGISSNSEDHFSAIDDAELILGRKLTNLENLGKVEK